MGESHVLSPRGRPILSLLGLDVPPPLSSSFPSLFLFLGFSSSRCSTLLYFVRNVALGLVQARHRSRNEQKVCPEDMLSMKLQLFFCAMAG